LSPCFDPVDLGFCGIQAPVYGLGEGHLSPIQQLTASIGVLVGLLLLQGLVF
jgi:hypothetical protein